MSQHQREPGPVVRSLRPLLVGLTVIVALTMAACSATSSTKASGKESDTLVMGITRPAGSIDPTEGLSKSAGFLQKAAMVAMARVSEDGSLKPELATKWSSNKDASVWTFTLRSGKWTNGHAFTAADIVSTLNLYMNPKDPSPAVAGYSGILSYGKYKAVDKHTIEFDLDRSYVDFPYVVAYGPALWLPTGYKVGQYAAGKTGGLGPFLLTSYDADSGATFVKNPNYWNAKSIHFEHLKVRFYDDEQSMALALQSGEVDMLPIISNSAAVALTKVKTVKLLDSSSSAYYSLRMRTDTAPFNDVRVRKALALAIDRKAIVKTLYDGKADVGNDDVFAPAFPQSKAVIAAVPQRKQDITKAKALLAAAGFPNGITMTVDSEQYGDIPAYLQLVQSQVAEAGITLKINLMSQADYYGSTGNEPWLDVTLGSTDWGERSTASAMASVAYVSGAPFNESRWSNAEFDKTMAAYDAETDKDARAQLAIKAAKIMNDQVPSIIAFFPRQIRAVSTSVSGLPAGPASSIDLAGVVKK